MLKLDYDSHTSRTDVSFLSVNVNPLFVQNNLLYENNIDADDTQSIQKSANFIEIIRFLKFKKDNFLN